MDMFSRINSCSSSVADGGFHCSGRGTETADVLGIMCQSPG